MADEEGAGPGPLLDPKTVASIRGFEVLRLLGHGGMGLVYLARQVSLGRLVALKVLRSGPWINEELIARFSREARAAALTHRHIVPIYDYGEWEGGFYLSMGYMPGGSVQTAVSELGRLSAERTSAIGAQIASALAYAHGKGIVHRDVKPSNILLDEEGDALLADFGIAHIAQATRLTGTAQWVGTPEYMAPELTTGARASAASDIYALGVTLYECVAGTTPFRGDDPYVALYQHRFEPVPDLPQDVPYPLGLAILRALEKEPAARYGSASEFARELQRGEPTRSADLAPTVRVVDAPEAAGPASPLPGTLPAPPATPVSAPVGEIERPKVEAPAPRRRGGWLAFVAVSVVALGVVAVLALTGGEDEPGPGVDATELPPAEVDPPTDVRASTIDDGAILVRWSFPEGLDITGFQVVEGDRPVGAILGTGQRALQIETLEPASEHCYAVAVVTVDGEAAISAEDCAATDPLLTAVGNLRAQVVAPDAILLTWVDGSVGEGGYRVFEGEDPAGRLGPDRDRLRVEPLDPGRHCFTVLAFGGGQDGIESAPACATIVPPEAPGQGASPPPGDGTDGGGGGGGTTAQAPVPNLSKQTSGVSVSLSWSAPGADQVCFTSGSSEPVAGQCHAPSGSDSFIVDSGSSNQWCAYSVLDGDTSGTTCESYTAPTSRPAVAGVGRSVRVGIEGGVWR